MSAYALGSAESRHGWLAGLVDVRPAAQTDRLERSFKWFK